MSSIVTQYRVGDYTAQLAESWKVSEDMKTWVFKIRSGLTFENGDPITPQTIVNSWMRMAFLLKQRDSKSGLMEELVDYEKIKSLDSQIEGLKIQDQNIVLKFKKPFPKLLDTISFGLYGVAHPSLYDAKTGAWKDPKAFISSGAYKIKEWTNDKLVLSLRQDFLPTLRHPTPIQEVNIVWGPNQKLNSDMKSGDSIESSLAKDHEFYGAVVSSMAYVHCLSWSHPKSPCFNLEQRRKLRALFYDGFDKQALKSTRSFFPLSISGVKEMPKDIPDSKIKIPKTINIRKRSLESILSDSYNGAMEELIKKLNLKAVFQEVSYQKIFEESTPHRSTYSIDMTLRVTGILIDDPDADIRFMFLSKEGIRLPDTDGRIHEELKKDLLDIQRINELLWEQAVIWPITHFASGFWAKKNMFDFSMVNLVLPPTEFQWIGWKK
jgi:hypothetical protein